MKRRALFPICLLVLLTACKQASDQPATEAAVINLEQEIEQPKELTLADFGRHVRYVPLETNDSCLIDNDPHIVLLERSILVYTSKRCLLFDRETGRFLHEIGHQGADPTAIKISNGFTLDDKEQHIYFTRPQGGFTIYGIDGRFAGTQELIKHAWDNFTDFLINDSMMVAYSSNLFVNTGKSLAFFDKEGRLTDSIPPLRQEKEAVVQKEVIALSSLYPGEGKETYGKGCRLGGFLVHYYGGGGRMVLSSDFTLWACGGQNRFRENLTDTIYNIEGQKLSPYMVFHTGKYHVDSRIALEDPKGDDGIRIVYTEENERMLFFQFRMKKELYNGLYDKHTGETKMVKYSDRIEDNGNTRLPLDIYTLTLKKESCAFLTHAADVLDWLDEHPEARSNQQLSSLAGLKEDDNPVITIID